MKKIILTLLTTIILLGTVATIQPKVNASEVTNTASSVSFTDIPSTHWANGAIQAAVKDGVVTGYTDGTFKPSSQLKENEFYAMLLRSFDKSLNNGSNTNGGNWADPYYKFAAEMNYPTHTKRTQVLTRTRVAEIIVGIQGYNFSGDDAIQFMIATGLSNGKTNDTIKGYQGNDKLTRAEAVAFIAGVKTKLGADFTLKARPKTASDKSLLPQIGILSGNIVGMRDSALEAQAIKANQVASKYDMNAGYNSSDGVVFLESADGYITMVYSDDEDADGTVIVTGYNLMNNHKVVDDRVNTMVGVMQALGLKVDSKLVAGITKALGAGVTDVTVQYPGFNVEIIKVKYGTIVMYIEKI